jgi:hypothetical protein
MLTMIAIYKSAHIAVLDHEGCSIGVYSPIFSSRVTEVALFVAPDRTAFVLTHVLLGNRPSCSA